MKPSISIANILRKTKTIIRHSNLFNEFINSTRKKKQNRVVKYKGISPPKEFSSIINNKIMIKSMSVDSIHLPHISDTIYIQPKEVMLQIQQQREMLMPKPTRKINPSEVRFNNDIFSKTGYCHLVYDESLIFNRRAHYQHIINEQIVYFQYNKNKNMTDIMTQMIIDKENRQLELTLTSLKIKFTNEKEHISFEFVLPLALLPIYYAMSFKKFILMLAGLVQFNENYDDCKINEDFIYLFIKKEFSKRKSKANMALNSEINIIDNPKRILISKYKEKSHNHIFNWITPKRTYRVHVIEPLVQLIVLKQHIRFNKYIDFDLLFFLYEKKFVSWDFYLINYLFSYKRVRTVFDKLVSKSLLEPIENMVINLNKEYIDDYSVYDIQNDYLYTDDNMETVLYRIKSGHMILAYSWLNFDGVTMKTNYFIQFSIGEMKLLLKMSNKLHHFLSIMKRFANIKPLINKAEVSFDFDSLDTFPVNAFKEDDDSSVDSDTLIGTNIQIVCGFLEKYTKMDNDLWGLITSFELTKDNGSSLYHEKKWNQGRAILSIQEDIRKAIKKKETIKQPINSISTPQSKNKKTLSDLNIHRPTLKNEK